MSTNVFGQATTSPPPLVCKYGNPTIYSNEIYDIKYKIVGFEDLRHSADKLNHNFNTQLLIIISELPTPNFACNVLEYFKDGRPMLTG